MFREQPPVPSLRQLQWTSCWWWCHCRNVNCQHRAPVVLAPVMIVFGCDASSDVLRERARCSKCGGLGAMLFHPG